MSTATALTDRLRDTFSTAKLQLVTLEKEVEGRVQTLERRALDVPHQLRGVWDTVLVRLRSALSIATRRELAELAARVEELTAKVDQLVKQGQPTLAAPTLELVAEPHVAVADEAVVAEVAVLADEPAASEPAVTEEPSTPARQPKRKPPAKNNRR